MNEEEKRSEVNEITELLVRLRPARAELDSRVVFYESGYVAAQEESSNTSRPLRHAAIAATLLAMVITSGASYRWGRNTALSDRETRVVVAAPLIPAEGNLANTNPTPLDPSTLPTAEDSQVTSRPPREVTASKGEVTASVGELGGRANLFAGWMSPLSGLGDSVDRVRGDKTTLAAFHGSVITASDANDQGIDFPFSSTLSKFRDFSFVATPDDPSDAAAPLTVSDFQQVAHSLEATR